MTNLLLDQIYPLQADCNTMACDGQLLYTFHRSDSTIFRLEAQGETACASPTRPRYQSVCYDDKDGCFWAVPAGPSNRMIRLNQAWEETGTLAITCSSTPINHIFYVRATDSLLLGTCSMLYRMSKQGDILTTYRAPSDALIMAAGDLGGDTLLVSNSLFTSPDVIRVLSSGTSQTENITCLPDGHRCYSLCAAAGTNGTSFLYLLTKKNGRSYVLKYRFYLPAVIQPSDCADGYLSEQEYRQMVCIQELTI